MKENIRFTKVNGIEFQVWTDITARSTIAMNCNTGRAKALTKGGYISNDLTVRKAIALAFDLPTFRK